MSDRNSVIPTKSPIDVVPLVPDMVSTPLANSMVVLGLRDSMIQGTIRCDFPSLPDKNDLLDQLTEYLHSLECTSVILLSYVNPTYVDPSPTTRKVETHLNRGGIDIMVRMTVHREHVWLHDSDTGRLILEGPHPVPAATAPVELFLINNGPEPVLDLKKALALFSQRVEEESRDAVALAIANLKRDLTGYDDILTSALDWQQQRHLPTAHEDIALLALAATNGHGWQLLASDIVHHPRGAQWRLWIYIAAHVFGSHAGSCLFLAGVAAYRHGYGTIADNALTMALKHEPNLHRARQLRHLLRQGWPPTQLLTIFAT